MSVRAAIIVGMTTVTLTTTGIAITEHFATYEVTAKSASLSSKVGALEADLVAAKRAHASAEAHAGALQLQMDNLKSAIDEKTALIRYLFNLAE